MYKIQQLFFLNNINSFQKEKMDKLKKIKDPSGLTRGCVINAKRSLKSYIYFIKN